MGRMADSEQVVEFSTLPIPVSVLADASYQQKDALVPVLVHPKHGVQLRRAHQKKNDGKLAVVPYFKGKRLFEAFKNDVSPFEGSECTAENSPTILAFGEWLLKERYLTQSKICDSIKKELAPVDLSAQCFLEGGFYIWTHRGRKLAPAAASSPSRSASTDDEFSPTRGSSKSEDVSAKKEDGGIRWLPMAMLVMIVAPSLFAVGDALFSFIATSSLGLSLGLSQTPRQRLEAFYAVNAPEKANPDNIDKLMKKWKGKEERLFDKLEKKYEQVRKREEAMKQDEREHGNGEDE
jgi:hypothetical protein